MFSAGYQHGSRASCSSPSTDSPKQRKRKPAVKERRLELAVQVPDCGHDDDRGRISALAGPPVFIQPLRGGQLKGGCKTTARRISWSLGLSCPLLTATG